MDDSRFKNLVRALTAFPSRRAVLRALGTLALSAGIASSFEEAAARKCGECKKKTNGRCKKVKDGTFCSVGTCRNGRCGCASINDCYVNGGTGSDGQICQEGRCVCTAQGTHRCKEFDGVCGECCSPCSGGRICFNVTGAFRCYCNSFVAVDCQQVCIPKECDGQCAKSCTGFGADCGCGDYLSCQQDGPENLRCLPTGKFIE